MGLIAQDVAFQAVGSKNDKTPSCIVHVGDSTIGAAWKKANNEGKSYLSVKLDGPTFAAPIQCALVKVDNASHLAWSDHALAPRRTNAPAKPSSDSHRPGLTAEDFTFRHGRF